MRWVGLELAAKLIHVGAEVLAFFSVLRAPHGCEQRPMSDGAAGALHQHAEKVELGGS